jgi:ATP-dependent helicase HrpA
VAELLDDCVLAAAGTLVERHGPAWDEVGFDALGAYVGAELADAARQVLDEVVRVLAAWREADRALSGAVDMAMLPAMADMRAQVERLVRRGFVADIGAETLRHLPRYLAAVAARRERLAADPHRDRMLMDQVRPLQETYQNRVAALPEGQPEPLPLRRVRWLLEEYRVSLWAQHLRTAEPVSEARIRKALEGA